MGNKLEMRLRAAMPASVKSLYRVVRALGPFEPAPVIPPDLLSTARVCSTRYDLISRLPKGGVVAELGTQRGDFARAILNSSHPVALHLVDIDDTAFIDKDLPSPPVTRHKGYTDAVITTFSDNHFDWIYVDADHSYAGVLKDARAAASKVKPGGFLVFNDFAHIDPYLGRYGVKRAVTEFMIEARWPMAYLAFDGYGLYDVALQRPA